MQINLNKVQLSRLIPYAVIGILILLLWFKSCTGSTVKENLTVEVPEVKGKFEPQKPNHEIIDIDHKKNNLIKANSPQLENPLIKVLANENSELLKQFSITKDSLTKLKLYNDAIKIQNFSSDFEDENIKLNISGIVRGEVQAVTPKYVMKSKTIEVPKQKEVVFRLLGGVEIGDNKQLNDFAFKGNLGFQNKKGNIITLSYDTQQRVWIGYQFSIFSIKGK